MSKSVDLASAGAIARALGVLEYLARVDEPTRLSTVATDLGLRKSTAHRILGSLIGAGCVEQEQETRLYAATLRAWELGTHTLYQRAIMHATVGTLEDLHRLTGETVSLTVLAGDDVLYLDKIRSPRPVLFTNRVGSRIPAPLTGSGKAILALLQDARARVARIAAQPRKMRCIDVDALLRELAEVRSRGYANSHYRYGVMSVAAALTTRGGRPLGALTVSAPFDRIMNDRRESIVEHLLESCSRASDRLSR